MSQCPYAQSLADLLLGAAGQQNAVMSSTFPERLPTERPGSQLPAIFYVQVSLISSMLPGQRRYSSQAEEQLHDSLPEQLQEDVTVATVDSYQVRLPVEWDNHHLCDSMQTP